MAREYSKRFWRIQTTAETPRPGVLERFPELETHLRQAERYEQLGLEYRYNVNTGLTRVDLWVPDLGLGLRLVPDSAELAFSHEDRLHWQLHRFCVIVPARSLDPRLPWLADRVGHWNWRKERIDPDMTFERYLHGIGYPIREAAPPETAPPRVSEGGANL